MSNKSYVYKITNKVNNKIYIGKSNDPKLRWKKHLYTVKYGDKKCGFQYIHAAIRKHGVDNFIFEVIEICDLEEVALEKEVYWVKYYQSNNREIGYNLTDGGEGVSGRKYSDEEKLQKSIYMTNYYANHIHPSTGRTLTEKHKKIISKSNKGRVQSTEVKQKISAANSGIGNGQYGKKYSIKERQQLSKSISEAKRNSPPTPHVVSLETIEKLKIAVREKSSQKLSDNQKDQIITLYNSGNFLKRDLANKFSVEVKTIQYIIRHWTEVKNNKAKYLTTDQKDQIITLYLSKQHTKQEISNIVKIPLNRIIAAIRSYQNMTNK
jgi:group I intron endonuclease